MAEQREGSPRIEDGEVNVDEELQRMQAELAKFEDEKNQVGVVCVEVTFLSARGCWHATLRRVSRVESVWL